MDTVNRLLEGANPYKNLQNQAGKLAAKWGKSGLLEGISSSTEKNNMAILLDNQAKQLAIDLELSSLKDKRLELEAKIESGEIDAKAGQNLVNLFKLTIASSQWSAGKIAPKKFGKAAETLSIKSDNAQPLTISWSK